MCDDKVNVNGKLKYVERDRSHVSEKAATDRHRWMSLDYITLHFIYEILLIIFNGFGVRRDVFIIIGLVSVSVGSRFGDVQNFKQQQKIVAAAACCSYGTRQVFKCFHI